jgi:hypothetical protein
LKPITGDHAKALKLAKASVVNHPVERHRTILPYGFVQSPLLASLVLDQSSLGSTLRDLANRADLHVSVYVDDILLSGDDVEALSLAKEHVKLAADRSRLFLSPDKEVGPASAISAFNVNITAASDLAITEARMTDFANVIQAKPAENVATGIIGYVRTVNPQQADQLTALFAGGTP